MLVRAAPNNVGPQYFLRLGLELAGLNHVDRLTEARKLTEYQQEYGSKPKVHAKMFEDMKSQRDNGTRGIPADANPVHFLWAVAWLYQYQKLHKMRRQYNRREETISRWVWFYVTKINELFDLKIVFRWRENPDNPGEIFILSVDGVHTLIQEPGGFDKRYMSHKYGKAAYNYEVGVAVRESKIVHVCGPTFQQNDGTVSLRPDGIQSKVPAGKKVIADRGYKDYNPTGILSTPSDRDPDPLKKFKNRALSRHESLNSRLKRFDILKHTFRHEKEKHGAVFRAVCVIVQYEMDLGDPLFDV